MRPEAPSASLVGTFLRTGYSQSKLSLTIEARTGGLILLRGQQRGDPDRIPLTRGLDSLDGA